MSSEETKDTRFGLHQYFDTKFAKRKAEEEINVDQTHKEEAKQTWTSENDEESKISENGLYDFTDLDDIDPHLKNYFETEISPDYNQGKSNFNTEYIVSLVKLCKKLEGKELKGTFEDETCKMEIFTGDLPTVEGSETEKERVKVVSTGITIDQKYSFGMIVSALSDIQKRPEWDENIDGLQVFQNFATNGFIYRTKFAPVTKVTLPEDSVEK